jgi:serine phosphatase RsbU (regulator of sigma subunit)
LTIANAGLPYPVLYSSRRGKCDRLPVTGDLIFDRSADEPAVHFDQRRVEIAPRDILVMVTDGLTESRGLGGDSFGYRFTRIIEGLAGRGARVIGEAILDEWRKHPRLEDDFDDVTVMVVALADEPRGAAGLTRG